MIDLSILIPARDEEFLGITIQNILDNIEGNTEVIAVLDGYITKVPKLPRDPRVTIVTLPKSVGQRAATNLACKLSSANYVMKADAHLAFDKGFDVKMISEMQDNWTMIPVMRNLHAFDWVCKCGYREYQGPQHPCPTCANVLKKEIVWIAKVNPQSTAYRFDKNLHFQYWAEFGKNQQGDITETMSIQGSCFMLKREKYIELDICAEEFGSWGQQGVEVACKTWLSGGRVVVNRKTWYAHMFRTQEGFSFPWPASGAAQERARDLSKDIFLNDKWPKAVHPFKWLIDKFQPIPGWEEVTKGIIYYTDNRLNEKIMKRCQEQLMKVESSTLPIVSVSLKPIEFGQNYTMEAERGYLTVTKQIIKALEESTSDVIFFCEHDVLYHPSHFDFTPIKKDVFYYNMNSWMLRESDGHCLYYDHRSLSGMCCYRQTALGHFKKRKERIEALMAEAGDTGKVQATSGTTISLKEGIHRLGFEPGTHNRPEKIDTLKAESWKSEFPNVDIRHSGNLTQNRFRKDQFRNARSYAGWTEADKIPFWGEGVEIV
ncbi:glycosyltransferase [Candidatus Microgenomates bacterium]|nr:glycosyltransferase [Candidatus Microgenomates bacterium]